MPYVCRLRPDGYVMTYEVMFPARCIPTLHSPHWTTFAIAVRSPLAAVATTAARRRPAARSAAWRGHRQTRVHRRPRAGTRAAPSMHSTVDSKAGVPLKALPSLSTSPRWPPQLAHQSSEPRAKEVKLVSVSTPASAVANEGQPVLSNIAWTLGQTRREREQEAPWLNSTTKHNVYVPTNSPQGIPHSGY